MKPKLFYKLLALMIATGLFITEFAQTTTPLDDYILDKMKDKVYTPGLAFSLIKNGKVALARGYGYADIGKDIPFTPNIIMSEIASISKTVTATAVMKLWEEGLFQLDDPINNYLPFGIKNPYFPNTPITFRMLLCHKSSIESNEGSTTFLFVPPGTGMSLESFIQNRLVPGGSLYNLESSSFDNNPPGVRYHYSNTGYALLGYLVERISGMPFDEYCKQKIFQPLCMNQTAWFYSRVDTNIIARPYDTYNGNPQTQASEIALYERLDYPCSQLKTTVIDLSKYLQMHMNFGMLNGVRIIDSTTEVMMRTPQVNVVTNATVIHDGVPVIFNIDGCLGFLKITHTSEGNKVFIGHDGADPGVSTQFWINTSNNTGEIIFVNSPDLEEQFAAVNIHFFLEQSVADTISTSGLPDLNCSYSFNPCEHNADYWNNNQNKWALNSVPMKLGTKLYYSKNQILALLNRADNVDASIVLAKALITAKFNVAQGSELSPVVLTINSAMNLIGNHRLPYDNPVSFSSATGIQMLNLAGTLNSYNSGGLNTKSCSGTLSAIAKTDLKTQRESISYSLSVLPNPVTSLATISFSLPQQEKVSLKIFDVNGRLISSVIADAEFSAGAHQLKWDAANLKAGIYVLKMQAGNYRETRKLVVAK